MEENLSLRIKGKVVIAQSKGETRVIENAIQPEATNIIRRCIAVGNPKLTQIRVLDGVTEIGLFPIQTSSIAFLGVPGSVRFRTILSEESFSGSFNGIHLLSSNNLPFSKLEGFDPIVKTSDNQIIIDWILTIEVITP